MRVLLVKTSSLGDVVHNCPAASDLARALPGARIDWVVEEPFAAIARMHAAVRGVIPVALRRWRAGLWRASVWSEIGAFRRAVSQGGYEHVIDTQGLLKSALVCAIAPGVRHGMDRDSVREPIAARFYDARHAVPRARHAVERNRLLCAAALGYALEGECDYGLRVGGAAPQAVRSPYAVLLTMSSRAAKLWPEERWGELARALAGRGVQPVLPWGSEEERRRCERLAARAEGALVPARMALEELARLLCGARAVAGVDTGLVHLAAALGVPAVGIYCASDPALTGLYGGARVRNLGGEGAPPASARVLAALEELM